MNIIEYEDALPLSSDQIEAEVGSFERVKNNPDSRGSWRDNKSAGECVRHFCLSEQLSDVVFTFKDCDRELPAHKLFLSMRSEVFEAMFFGPMAESKETVMIPDIDVSIMELVLRYIYTDVASLNGYNVLACLYAANKYAISGLVAKCSEFLETSVAACNVCTIYEQAKVYDMKSLQSRCFNFAIQHFEEVQRSNGFRMLSRESLQSILESEENSCGESLIFSAAMQWAESQFAKEKSSAKSDEKKDLRAYLGDIIYTIRFPLMSIEIFAKDVAPTSILTKEEMLSIYGYLATKGAGYNQQMIGKFCCRERRCKTNQFTTIHAKRAKWKGRARRSMMPSPNYLGESP